jgi:hypothetical protein
VRILFAAVLACLACASPASAFAPPELFVRLQTTDTHEPASDWIPLASAPHLEYLGGYQVGYRLQVGGFQRAALTVTGVPDGQPTQPPNTPPVCVGKNGTAGTIVEVGAEVQFEGSGRYDVSVSVGADLDCMTAGETNTASFTAGAAVAPALVGEPLAFRVDPLGENEFVGVRANVPPGGQADTRCALDAAIAPDGSVSGRIVIPGDPERTLADMIEDNFSRPGAWTCVSRGISEGLNPEFETTVFGTPWSAPLAVLVRADFQRVRGQLIGPRSRRPRLRFFAEFPEATTGGRGTLTLRRFVRCRGRREVYRRFARQRAAFDARGRVQFRIRRPRREGIYVGELGFGGTRLYRAGADPKPVLLVFLRRKLDFIAPQDVGGC